MSTIARAMIPGQVRTQPAAPTASVQLQAMRMRQRHRRKLMTVKHVRAEPRPINYCVELATHNPVLPLVLPSMGIAMVTTDRKISTIEASIASVRRAGFKQHIHIFSQAKNADYTGLQRQDGNITIRRVNSKGGTANWKAAADYLSQQPVDWAMILEDDIAWCRNGAAIMYYTINQIEHNTDGIKRHRIGMLSAYTSPAMVGCESLKNGWTEARFYGSTKGLWGALALCLPKDVLCDMLKNPKYMAHNVPTAIDYAVGDVLRHNEPPLEVKVHIPSLVEHTGEHSTIFSDEAIRAPGINALRHGYKFDDNYGDLHVVHTAASKTHDTGVQEVDK